MISHSILRFSNFPYKEILKSKQLLEEKIGKPVNHFAYPYGKIHAESFKNIKMPKRVA